jgi:hypothetical protein
MLGGPRFNPNLVVTDPGEIESLVKHLNINWLKRKIGVDPFAGTRQIPQIFKREGIDLVTNEINKLFPASFHYDAVNPASYVESKLGRFDYAVTSIPFAFADLVIPLLTLAFEAVFLHLPSWYLFQGSRFRHQRLVELVSQRRIIILHVNPERNIQFGKYAVWVCIFAKRELAHKYLLNSNRLFEKALPVFFGTNLLPPDTG